MWTGWGYNNIFLKHIKGTDWSQNSHRAVGLAESFCWSEWDIEGTEEGEFQKTNLFLGQNFVVKKILLGK